MAKTKATGATRLGRDSLPKHLGIKLFEGETAKVGQILIRQRGNKFYAGKNVKEAGDDTLYAMKAGKVHFVKKTKKKFDGSKKVIKIVSIETR